MLYTMIFLGPEKRALRKRKDKSSECFIVAFQKLLGVKLERIFPEEL